MSSSADRPRRPARVLRGQVAAELRGAEAIALTSAAAFAVLPGAERPARADELEVARAEGHADGYAKGYAAALAGAEIARVHALEILAQRLAGAAATAAASRETIAEQVTEDAVELTYALARTILGNEAMAASLPARDAVARALRLAPQGEDLVVRVPPSSELSAADLIGLYDTARISIRADATVEEGGCIVEAGACRIDTQISTALERVRKVLAGVRPSGEAPSGEGVEEVGA